MVGSHLALYAHHGTRVCLELYAQHTVLRCAPACLVGLTAGLGAVKRRKRGHAAIRSRSQLEEPAFIKLLALADGILVF